MVRDVSPLRSLLLTNLGNSDDEEPPGSSFTLLEAAQEGVVQPVPTRAEHQWRRSVDLLEFVAGHWGLAASV